MWGNPPVTGGFPSQRASIAENVSIWWRHHVRLPHCTQYRAMINRATTRSNCIRNYMCHDDVIHFPRYWPFVGGIHRSPMNSPHEGHLAHVYVFFDLRLNKRLRKQSWGWWCETPSHSPWRHCDGEDIANQSMMQRASRTNSHSSLYMSQQIFCVKMFCFFCMLTSWNRKTFCITGPLWGQCTGDRWFPSQRVSNADLRYFPWC